jgi:hypothetical protein
MLLWVSNYGDGDQEREAQPKAQFGPTDKPLLADINYFHAPKALTLP